jgi:3-isopropylmalate dehydrogenase
MRFNIATLPGDGVGPEVIGEGIKVLKAVEEITGGFSLDFEEYEAGAGCYLRIGDVFPAATYDACKASHAIFLGAMGLPEVKEKDGTEVQGKCNITMRKEMNLFAGVRPIKLYPGVKSPLADVSNIDFVIVRESSEGQFASFLGGCEVFNEVVGDTMLITRKTTEKVCDYAFKLALKRNGRPFDNKRIVTSCDKANIFRSFAFFRKIFNEIADKYQGEVERDYAYADAMTLWMLQKPDYYDVIVTENFLGDIISDLAAGLIGGMGMAPSGDIGFDHAIFQPAHGSAPTIAGKGIVNPAATILSGGMMLDWLGEKYGNEPAKRAAAMIEAAVSCTIKDGIKTSDIGGTSSTTVFSEAVVGNLRRGLNK